MKKIYKEELEKVGQNTRRIFTRTLPNDPEKDYYYMHRDTGQVETIIIEYGFADNEKDTERIFANWHEYAQAIVKAHTELVYLHITRRQTFQLR